MRITIQDLAKELNMCKDTIRRYTGRPEFTKFYHRDRETGRTKVTFEYNAEFVTTFNEFLQKLGKSERLKFKSEE